MNICCAMAIERVEKTSAPLAGTMRRALTSPALQEAKMANREIGAFCAPRKDQSYRLVASC